MELSELMAALGRALENPKLGSKGIRKSLEGTETPALDLRHTEAAEAVEAEVQPNQTHQPTVIGRHGLVLHFQI